MLREYDGNEAKCGELDEKLLVSITTSPPRMAKTPSERCLNDISVMNVEELRRWITPDSHPHILVVSSSFIVEDDEVPTIEPCLILMKAFTAERNENFGDDTSIRTFV
ncbi:hypothetical protein BLNAU_1211 [Blattamonas nauphoetae]|uniref:Uncharacterized protein n=1 Tax=Blattamonas nauphoetae TaxID=2049346 RepID=A0ABQ9YIR2_9EUKA|nr:hypothetical protein BLNAU_1211 [Blattamonas nauphoetae]